MATPVPIDGIVGAVAVTAPGFIKGAQLLHNGAPAPKGDKRNHFALPRADGGTATVKLVPSWTRTVPSLEVDGRKLELGEKIPLFLLVWGMLPIGLVAIGGLLGGALGGGAVGANLMVLRMELSTTMKILVTTFVNGCAVAIVFLIAFGLALMQA